MVWRRPSLTQAYSKALLAGEAAIVFEAFCVLLNHEKIVGRKKKKVLESLFIKEDKNKFENAK